MIRVVIVDVQESDRNSTARALSCNDDFELVGLGRDGFDAFRLVSHLKPDVAVMDFGKDSNETSVIPLLKRKFPAMAIILFTSWEDERHVCEAMGYKVSGYLLKHTDMDKLAAAVRVVHGGGTFFNPRIIDKTLRIFSDVVRHKHIFRDILANTLQQGSIIPSNMTKIELKLIACIGQGFTTREMAKNLSLSTGTVRNYISQVLQKTGLRNRNQVASFAIKHDLVKLV
jgi:DNA-binding NarL/FixJ family response regulator